MEYGKLLITKDLEQKSIYNILEEELDNPIANLSALPKFICCFHCPRGPKDSLGECLRRGYYSKRHPWFQQNADSQLNEPVEFFKIPKLSKGVSPLLVCWPADREGRTSMYYEALAQ